VLVFKTVHNDPSMSSKIVDFGTDLKRIGDFLLVLSSNLSPILPHITDLGAFVHQKPLSILLPIPAKISGCFLWSRSMMLNLAESVYPWYPTMKLFLTCIHMDRQSDRQTTYHRNTALCMASCGTRIKHIKVKSWRGQGQIRLSQMIQTWFKSNNDLICPSL